MMVCLSYFISENINNSYTKLLLFDLNTTYFAKDKVVNKI